MGVFTTSFKPDKKASALRDVEEAGSSLHCSWPAPELIGVRKLPDFEEKESRVLCQNDLEVGYEPAFSSSHPPFEAENNSALSSQVREDLERMSNGRLSAQA